MATRDVDVKDLTTTEILDLLDELENELEERIAEEEDEYDDLGFDPYDIDGAF